MPSIEYLVKMASGPDEQVTDATYGVLLAVVGTTWGPALTVGDSVAGKKFYDWLIDRSTDYRKAGMPIKHIFINLLAFNLRI
jgi:hypothetical protein